VTDWTERRNKQLVLERLQLVIDGLKTDQLKVIEHTSTTNDQLCQLFFTVGVQATEEQP